MISRTSTRALAELIEIAFREPHRFNSRSYFRPNRNALYDFLYENGYAGWFCNAAKSIEGQYETRPLKEFIMRLHTGETLAAGTPNWTWDQREVLGQRYLTDLAEDVLRYAKSGSAEIDPYAKQLIEPTTRALELDGYRWDGNRLIVGEAEVLDTAEELGVVQTLYRELLLGDEATSFHHLRLTEDHYIAGRWDDSIANSRKFLESTLSQIALRYASVKGAVAPDVTRPVRIRDYLEREGLLEEKEKQAVASVYGLLSETGSHPYVAKQEQARLMRHLALTFAQFVMLRLRSALAAA